MDCYLSEVKRWMVVSAGSQDIQERIKITASIAQHLTQPVSVLRRAVEAGLPDGESGRDLARAPIAVNGWIGRDETRAPGRIVV